MDYKQPEEKHTASSATEDNNKGELTIMSDNTEQPVKSSTGLDENIAGLLCYLGQIVTGIIFLVIEKENQFVRFHALQSLFTFGILFVAGIVLSAVPFIGWVIGLLIAPLGFILWIILMIKAYQGKWFKLPIIAGLVEKQLNQKKAQS